MSRYFKYYQIFITFLIATRVVSAVSTELVTKNDEILSVLKEYVVLNNPNTLDDLNQKELADVKNFNEKYSELSDRLGKEEIFYYIELSKRIQQPHLTYLGSVIKVPELYLEHYQEYDLNEKQIIGEFIWEHHQDGDLSINSLRKITLPQVVKYLTEELAKEGGTNTGRGYKIWKLLDEIGALPAPSDTSQQPSIVDQTAAEVAVVSANMVDKEDIEVVRVAEPSEEPVEESSQWWLWLVGALVVLGGLAMVVRRKS